MADQPKPDSSKGNVAREGKDTSNHFVGVPPERWPLWAQPEPTPPNHPS